MFPEFNFMRRLRSLVFLVASSASRLALAANPIVPDVGLTDPNVIVYGDRAYVYATHDFSPENKKFLMKDWWVWSSPDLVHWKQESILKPEETFLKRPFDDCWATTAAAKNGKYYWYFSAGRNEIGVVVADSPVGPWKDPLGKPLIPKGLTPTQQRDPDVLVDDDGRAYLVFGTYDYFIAPLNDDMISLAEAPHPVRFDRKFGPYGEGKTDDKPFLHKRNGIYYLSWSSFYATSPTIYGPYTYRGSVLDPKTVAPEFKPSRPKFNLWLDRHGNFFTWHNQWYYAFNDAGLPGTHMYYRNACIGYVHFRDNGEMAPVRLDSTGVGQYDARQPRIEAEDYFGAEKAEVRESPSGGFDVRGLSDGSTLRFPNVANMSADSPVTFHASCANPAAATIEIRQSTPLGALLGTCKVDDTGGWDRYRNVSTKLTNQAGTQDICLVIKGPKTECLRLDWFSFTPSAPPAAR